MELKNKVESVLFSAGKRMLLEEIAKLCRAPIEDVEEALNQLKEDYSKKESSLMIVQDGAYWKLNVKERYLGVVRKIVTTTELSKTIMETLAVVAWKAPVKQSDVIKIRTNKAYDHLKELEDADYITREKHGRTKLIRLSKKFFEYFDIPEDRLKEKFKTVDQMAKAIEGKEKEIEAVKKEQEKKARQEKAEIDLTDKEGHKVALEKYELSEEDRLKAEGQELPKIKPDLERVGELNVIDEPIQEGEHKKLGKFEVFEEGAEGKPKEKEKEEAPAEEPEEEQEKGEEKGEEEEEPEEEPQEEEPKKQGLKISDETFKEAAKEVKAEEKEKKEDKENHEIEDALSEIEKEKEEEQEKGEEKGEEEEEPEEEPQEEEEEKKKPILSKEEEMSYEKRAEKRAEEILHPKGEEKVSKEVEAEVESILHPHGTEKTEEEETEPAPEGFTTAEKPDFEEEAKDMIESGGEKAELPKLDEKGKPKDIVEARKEKPKEQPKKEKAQKKEVERREVKK